MYLYKSCINLVINSIEKEVRERDCAAVAWCGFHPCFPIFYKFLRDIGIKEIRIFDNNAVLQNNLQYPLGAEGEMDFLSIEKFPQNEKGFEKTVFLVFNSHFKEIANQLKGIGIGENRIIDLFSIENDWKNQEKEKIITEDSISLGEQQKICLNVLKHFRDECERLKLKYFLAEGTLLGAIRHKGFIPWDDDIDVFMPYEDYLEYIKKYENSEKYQLIDWRRNESYPIQFAKLVDNDTVLFHPTMCSYCVLGVGIDIFPIAGYPMEAERIQEKWIRNRELDEIYVQYCVSSNISEWEVKDIRQEVFDEKYMLSFYNSEIIGTMKQINFEPWVVEKQAFSEIIKVKFEDDYFDAPKGYERYLQSRYGDYLKMPPEDKRIAHPYPTCYINGQKRR